VARTPPPRDEGPSGYTVMRRLYDRDGRLVGFEYRWVSTRAPECTCTPATWVGAAPVYSYDGSGMRQGGQGA
jgi:hypothetical protein